MDHWLILLDNKKNDRDVIFFCGVSKYIIYKFLCFLKLFHTISMECRKLLVYVHDNDRIIE